MLLWLARNEDASSNAIQRNCDRIIYPNYLLISLLCTNLVFKYFIRRIFHRDRCRFRVNERADPSLLDRRISINNYQNKYDKRNNKNCKTETVTKLN